MDSENVTSNINNSYFVELLVKFSNKVAIKMYKKIRT